MRTRSGLFYSLLLAGALSGCAAATGERTASRTWWKTPVAKQAPDEKSKDSKPAAAETVKTDNPFRKSASSSAESATSGKTADQSSVKSTDTQTAQKEPAAKDADAKDTSTSSAAKVTGEKSSGDTLNAETLRLIDAELADATAQERSYWYEQLKRVDPAVIPQILQARRLTADLVEHQQQDGRASARKFPDSIEDSALRPAAGIDNGSRNSAVTHAVGYESGDSPRGLERAHYETDATATRRPILPAGYEAESTTPPALLANTSPAKSSYPVQRIASAAQTAPANEATPAAAPNPLTARNALSRLLPTPRAAATSTANSPSAVSLLPPTDIEQISATQPQLESLISQVEAEVAQMQPGSGEDAEVEYIQRHVYLRLLYLMARRPERALTAIPGIDPADQEFWQQMLWSMANYFDTEHIASAKDRAGQAVAQLNLAAQRLKERADLEIRNLAFCREIAYYGNFTRFNRDEFRPGDSALLYAEIDNFKSELTVDGQYRTLLRSTIEILSPAGEVRWQKEFPATEDLCISYRRDYFHNYQFNIPDRLPLGPHMLKLTVFDELSGKMLSQSINFVVR